MTDVVIRVRVDGSKDSAAAIKSVEAALQKQGIQVADIAPQTKRAAEGMSGLTAAMQTQIAAMQAGERNTAKYYAALSEIRNGPKKSQEEYLQQLRTLEQETAQRMGNMGVSAKQTAAAMRMVPAQFTDIVTQLQGGANPMTILMQQGGQLKDMFGGIGPAAQALGSYVIALVNPFTVAAAAAAVLGLAYYQGSKEADEFRKVLLLTGNTAGTTVGQLNIMAQSMGSQFGVTVGKAAEALTVMAATGEVSRDSLSKFAKTGIELEKAFDQPLAKTAQNFADLGKEPVKASLKLTDSLHYLTASTLEQIMEAERLGDKEKAAALAQDAYKEAMDQRTKTMVKNLGWAEEAWATLGNAAKKSWDFILGVGRVDTEEEKLKRQISDHEGLIADLGKGSLTKDAQAELAILKGKKQAIDDIAASQGRANTAEQEAVKARQSIAETNKSYQTSQERITEELQKYGRELNAIAAVNPYDGFLDPAKVNQKISAIMELPRKTAEAAQFAADLTRKGIEDQISQVKLLVDTRVLTEADGIERIGKLHIREMQASKSALDAQATAYAADAEKSLQYRRQSLLMSIDIANAEKQIIRDIDALRDKESRANLDENSQTAEAAYTRAKAVQEELKKQLESNMGIGLGSIALAEHKRALDLDRAASIERRAEIFDAMGGQDQMVESLHAEAKALRELADARVTGARLEEWKKASEQIRDVITNGLMRGFENGKGFWENFKSTLKNTVLSVTIQPVIKSMVSGLLGLGGSSAFAGQGDVFSQMSRMWSMFTSGFDRIGAGVSGMLNKAGDYLATSSSDFAASSGEFLQGFANQAGMFARYGAGAAAGIGIGSLISGGYSIGGSKNTTTLLGTALGAALGGPIGAAIGGAAGGLLNRAFGMGSVETNGSRLVGSIGMTSASLATQTSYHQDGGWFRSDRDWTVTQGIGQAAINSVYAQVTSVHDAIAKYATVLGGSTEALNTFTLAVNTTGSIDEVMHQFADGLANTVGNFSAVAKAGESASAAMERLVVSSQQFDNIATLLYGTDKTTHQGLWAGYGASSDVAVTANVKDTILSGFGGADVFSQSAQNYFTNFYTAAEQTARKTELLTKQFSDLGLAVPKSREEYKKLVDTLAVGASTGYADSIDIYKQVMNLSGAFAEVVPWSTAAADAASTLAKSFEELAKQFTDVMDSLKSERTSLDDQLYQLQRSAGQASMTERERFLANKTTGMDAEQVAAVAAAYDYNAALKVQILALQTAAQAEADRAASLSQIIQQRSGLETQLLQLQGNTAALRERELAALDPSNRALQEQIYALQDSQAATQAATQAEQALAQQRNGLETQLLQLQGNTAALRERELAALDPANRALQEQIYALQDSQAAAQAAAQTAQEQAQAAQQLRQAWEAVGNTMQDEVKRIRGLLTDGSNQSYASLQAQFAITSAQASAGDQTAAGQLAGLSQSLLTAAASSATSGVDLARIQASTAASIEATMRALSGLGVKVPSFDVGTNFVPNDMLAFIHAGEAIVPRAYNPDAGGVSAGVDMSADIQRLIERIASMQADNSAENRAAVALLQRMSRILDDVTQGGTFVRTGAAT